MERRPRRSERFVWNEVDGEAYVLSNDGLTLRLLNAAATHVWSRCDGTQTVEQIAAEMPQVFDVSEDLAREHVAEVLAEMHTLGLITYPDPDL